MQNYERYLQYSTFAAGLIQARAFRNLEAHMNAWLAAHQLNVTEWALLGLLAEGHAERPHELARQLLVSRPMSTRIVSKLEGLGYVSRREPALDRRGQLVRLTPGGEALVRAVEATVRGGMRELLAAVPRAELAVYLAVLDRIAAQPPPRTAAGS